MVDIRDKNGGFRFSLQINNLVFRCLCCYLVKIAKTPENLPSIEQFSMRYKKSTHKVLFYLNHKRDYFLDLREPKRDLNLSTRPPASATFCLPV